MSPGSNTVSYPAFPHIGLRENPGRNLNQGARQTKRWYGEHLHAEGQRGCITSTRRGEGAHATAACGVKGERTLPTFPEVGRSGDIQIIRESYLCTPVEISRNYDFAIEEETRSSARVCVRNCVSIRRPEFECSGPQLEGPEFECRGPQLEGPEFEYSGLSLKVCGSRYCELE
ncbi:hypothetical protein ANN_05761 [Periplaneta americana]|uniref:Uncharacterized protein n=1 Tax=Periplaneta americana TaxID=6978 RepID=A0ABQ8TDT4_PERAM|nr:hypothetical protein ANN_05761 [Periplaneta americana]